MTETREGFDDTWRDRRRHDVVASIEQFIDGIAADTAQSALLKLALSTSRAVSTAPGMFVPSVHIPLLVTATIGGDDEAGVGIARVTTIVETGVDLMDHVTDEELGPEWSAFPPATAQLVATGFLCALPALAISELSIPAGIALRVHTTLARGFVAMGAGQQLDLSLSGGSVPTLPALDEATAGKTGARRGLYAHLAAIVAGADDDACVTWARFGSSLGSAKQLASDLADVMRADGGRDLARGLSTWPVAWALSNTAGAEHESLADAVAAARHDAGAREAVRNAIRTSGALLRTSLEIERRKAQTLSILDAAPSRNEAALALRSIVASI